jgi:hypothetical protein
MSLTYKIVGDPSQSVTIGPEGVIFNPWSTSPRSQEHDK